MAPILEKNRERVTLIGIDGPTAAGKTILADSLADWIRTGLKRPCWIYRLDWHLAPRSERVEDLKSLVAKDISFPFEGELHMNLEGFGRFLKTTACFNERLETEANKKTEKILLENLYSRKDGGTLTGREECLLEPGLVILAEGHYTLRGEFHRLIDHNILMLGEEGELLRRKVARVEGYRAAQDAEDYFWRVDLPSFRHHLQRFGWNAETVIDNTDYRNPAFQNSSALPKWLAENGAEKGPLKGEIADSIFAHSQRVPAELKEALQTGLDWILDWDRQVGDYVRLSIDDVPTDLTSLTEESLAKANLKLMGKPYRLSLCHTNALYNVYARRLPISIGIRIEGEKPIHLLVDVFHETLRIQLSWAGGYRCFHAERELGEIDSQKRRLLSEKTPSLGKEGNGWNTLRLITPTPFTIPGFLKGFDYEEDLSGLEQENLSASQAISRMARHGGVWIHRFAKFAELEFFQDIVWQTGGHALSAGNYLIALWTRRQDLLQKFTAFAREWQAPFSEEEERAQDESALDALVEKERGDIQAFIRKNCPDFSVLDGYLYSSKISHDLKAWGRLLDQIQTMLLSKSRLVRKRALQFVQRHFPEITLETAKLWDDVPKGARPHISLDALTSIAPSILTEIYLWLALRGEPSSVLGANIYDIRKNSADCSAFLKAASERETAIVLQGSLNALGQKETGEGETTHGYLKPKEGAQDLVDSALTSARDMLLLEGKAPPLFGIGLDHVDVSGDKPKGRARRFLEKAIETEQVTHFTLDGSALFRARQRTAEELEESFHAVAGFAAHLMGEKPHTYIFDREICAGELNYVGKGEAMIPTPAEMELFARVCRSHFRKAGLGAHNTRPTLFIGNLGTTHHGADSGKVAVGEAKGWQGRLKKRSFVSPVLHGTTGSKPEVLAAASEGCHKINVAGDFLHTLIRGLPERLTVGLDTKDKDLKKQMPRLRSLMETLSLAEENRVREGLKNHCLSLLGRIQAPRLTPLDLKYFRYKNYKFSPMQVKTLREELERRIEEMRAGVSARPSDPSVGFEFSASMIEVPFDEEYKKLTRALWEEGIRHFHIDVGDGKFVPRKFSGLEKAKFLRKTFPQALLHCHLMVENPDRGENGGPSTIDEYLSAGVDAIALHRRAFAEEEDLHQALQTIRKRSARPGLIIETSDTLDCDLEDLLRKGSLDWVVVMGVPVGFGGQIFDMSSLKSIAWFHQFGLTHKRPMLIEVDGGLTLDNIALCKRSGAQIFSGWSIVKGACEEELRKKVRQARKRIA